MWMYASYNEPFKIPQNIYKLYLDWKVNIQINHGLCYKWRSPWINTLYLKKSNIRKNTTVGLIGLSHELEWKWYKVLYLLS